MAGAALLLLGGRSSCLWQTRQRVSCHRSSQRLGLLHPFTDLLLHFSQGRAFGHSAAGDAGLCAALPKLCPAWPGGAGWCCGAGGDISRFLATRGHPPHAQSILPGTKIADLCFVLRTSISPTIPAHTALFGGPRCPPEPHNPPALPEPFASSTSLESSSKNLAEAPAAAGRR